MWLLIRIQVIAVAGAILFARSVVADDWPYYQHDAWHTGNSSALLYVLNAKTGKLLYTVPIPEGPTSMMPTVVQDQINGNVTAFVADSGQVSAVSLGAASGSVLWTQFGLFGGQSIPTVVGSS